MPRPPSRFGSLSASEAGRKSAASRRLRAAPKEPKDPMAYFYACPPCRDSGVLIVRRYAPGHPEATLAGWITYQEPCGADPCLAPKEPTLDEWPITHPSVPPQKPPMEEK
jgi:hypothetical protein